MFRERLVLTKSFTGVMIWELQEKYWMDETIFFPEGEFYVSRILLGCSEDNQPMAEVEFLEKIDWRGFNEDSER